MYYRILMVCLGNICRSPTAQVVLQQKIDQCGLTKRITVDSAGTHATAHAGAPPDARAMHHARLRGYTLQGLRAKAVQRAHFASFDLVVAMDGANLAWLHQHCPPGQRSKLVTLGQYARTQTVPTQGVPDPYYGGPNGFEQVLDLVEDACDGLLHHLMPRFKLTLDSC
jgi:protein-tyrosine phosphatase